MADDIGHLVSVASGPMGTAQTRAAARLMSVLENQPHRLPELLARQDPGTAGAARLILGITGAPGAGKSTLTDTIIAEYRRRRPDRRIGVLAVDPSSPFTGGAVLGDRVRMMRHATDPMVYIRSMATRGHLGGLTLGARGAIRVMELIGCELVILETVGVGQSEVEVAQVADQTIVVLAPGQGDSIQMLKAGLMEVADLFVVNKADRPGSAELHATLLNMLQIAKTLETCGPYHHLGIEGLAIDDDDAPAPRPGAAPQVFLVSSVEQTGIATLLDALEKLADTRAGDWRQRRNAALRHEVRQAVLEEVRRRMQAALADHTAGNGRIDSVLTGHQSVADLADQLIRQAAGAPRPSPKDPHTA
jgi:LAO/AO transport system kinase